VAPATAPQVLTFAATVAGFVISWATLAADYTIYVPSNASKVKVFTYVYLGFFLPLCLLEILGAALVNAAFVYTPWIDGYNAGGVCGLLAAALHPAGRFGKFCMVVLAMS
jgi:purine-cytosine permease-like protein